MNDPSPPNVTQLLKDWGRGDREALDELVPLVYSELQRLSRYYLRRDGLHRELEPES